MYIVTSCVYALCIVLIGSDNLRKELDEARDATRAKYTALAELNAVSGTHYPSVYQSTHSSISICLHT